MSPPVCSECGVWSETGADDQYRAAHLPRCSKSFESRGIANPDRGNLETILVVRESVDRLAKTMDMTAAEITVDDIVNAARNEVENLRMALRELTDSRAAAYWRAKATHYKEMVEERYNRDCVGSRIRIADMLRPEDEKYFGSKGIGGLISNEALNERIKNGLFSTRLMSHEMLAARQLFDFLESTADLDEDANGEAFALATEEAGELRDIYKRARAGKA